MPEVSGYGVAFLITSVVEFIVMGVFQYYRGAAEDNPVGVLYNIIVSTQLVFLTAFAIDCVWNQNLMQLIAYLVYNFLFLAYIVSQLRYDAEQVVLFIQMGVWFVGLVILLALSAKLWGEFGWGIFKKIGKADESLIAAFRTFQLFMTFLKIDFSLQCVLIAQNLYLVVEPSDIEFWINVGAVPIIIIVAVMGAIGARREVTWMVIVFIVLAVIEPAYIIFRVVRLFAPENDGRDLPLTQMVGSAGVSILVRIATVFSSVLVVRNFGKGIREFLVGGSDKKSGGEAGSRSSSVKKYTTIGGLDDDDSAPSSFKRNNRLGSGGSDEKPPVDMMLTENEDDIAVDVAMAMDTMEMDVVMPGIDNVTQMPESPRPERRLGTADTDTAPFNSATGRDFSDGNDHGASFRGAADLRRTAATRSAAGTDFDVDNRPRRSIASPQALDSMAGPAVSTISEGVTSLDTDGLATGPPLMSNGSSGVGVGVSDGGGVSEFDTAAAPPRPSASESDIRAEFDFPTMEGLEGMSATDSMASGFNNFLIPSPSDGAMPPAYLDTAAFEIESAMQQINNSN